ncbi:MAG TPA: hypothetical protein VLK30_11765 [Candidatus Limnocylindrales bacterium]|nr:hypothetical protein [Candidatus Limnocylindrales bacterium]
MSRAWSFINGAGGAFILAVVIFGLAVVGHVPLPLALAMSGIMVAYGLILLLGRRWDPIAVLSAPGEDERTASAHTRAAATAGQVLALVIVGGFFYDVVRGAIDQSIWPPLGAVFGVTYLVGLFIAMRRG